MAQSTATWTTLKRSRTGGPGGALISIDYDINITAAGTDGVEVTAADKGYRAIAEVEILGGLENGGYILQYVPDAQGGVNIGDGDLRVYEAGADAAALDEVTTGDLGQFRVRISYQ